MRAENRHYKKVWAKKEHPASKCRKAKCTTCHSGKVFKQMKHSDKKKTHDKQ